MNKAIKMIAVAAIGVTAAIIAGCGDSRPTVDQSDPVAVAKAWWRAATENDLKGLLALTAEEDRKSIEQELAPHLPEISASYKGKPIDVRDGKAANTQAEIEEKNGKKYARVHVVLGGIGTKEANSQTSGLVLENGKWFVCDKKRMR